jgi:hypothetical protein
MSDKHIIKLTNNSAVVKLYQNSPSGGVVNVSLSTDLLRAGETFNASLVDVHLTQLYWSCRQNKDVVIQRVAPDTSLHGDYYLNGSGHFKFNGFRDSTYPNYNFRATFSGEGTVILVLAKENGYIV